MKEIKEKDCIQMYSSQDMAINEHQQERIEMNFKAIFPTSKSDSVDKENFETQWNCESAKVVPNVKPVTFVHDQRFTRSTSHELRDEKSNWVVYPDITPRNTKERSENWERPRKQRISAKTRPKTGGNEGREE
ncbi:hypothetical protein L484_019456 [Morus notabilis]|uniref:Uncharacterized protein n=1 Tax=Morus notabilis TaxID=981085 RepID=W9S4Y4_9ROSA|nr:hypothetical protein L484_019456 [Morus notabilis]